jgi:type VI secretion system protein ImpM
MFQQLIASSLVTPPAIWGKLPAHADFVRSRMRHGESEGWRPWLAEKGRLARSNRGADVPVSFVLPPGVLSFASRRFVIGVITPSLDKVGRVHPLLVYQLAHQRWVMAHFGQDEAMPRNWLFWLARAVARHTAVPAEADLHALERTVHGLWLGHAPRLRDLLAMGRQRERNASLQGQAALAHADALDRLAGPAPQNDPGAALRGVRFFPRMDWPSGLQRGRGEGVFWQQDTAGGYVNASSRLPTFWSAP